MAHLYSYKDKQLQQFIKNSLLIQTELQKYGVSYNQTEILNMDSFITDMFYKYDFVDYDIFKTMSALTTRSPHTHNDDEGRLIVKGSGRFYFEFDNIKIELHMDAGDFVIIPAGTIHHFNALEPIVAIRFFTTKEQNDR
jgi:cupin superfamily acireductone dioxygenase involved in methionine salvage